MSTFRRFERHEALPIINLSFKDNFPISAEMLQSIHAWFPEVCQVELKESVFDPVTSGSNNISLDLNGLHLQCLSIDLVHVLGRRGSVCNKVALEIVSGNTTTWYQRDGKCKARHGFKRKDRKSYIKEEAKQKRMESNTTTVITIRAAKVSNIIARIANRFSSLNQLIHLEDDSEQFASTRTHSLTEAIPIILPLPTTRSPYSALIFTL